MNKIQPNRNKKLINIAKILRRNMTKQERHLWYDFLQQYPIKIYKQRIIENYVVDFYCHRARLVIELDGSQHYTEKGAYNDSKRTKELEKYGIYVLRIYNTQIDEQFEDVCNYIDDIIKERIEGLSPPSHPTGPGALPKGEPLNH